VATPGRLIDHLDAGVLQSALAKLQTLVRRVLVIECAGGLTCIDVVGA
jgi:hypothetical protein